MIPNNTIFNFVDSCLTNHIIYNVYRYCKKIQKCLTGSEDWGGWTLIDPAITHKKHSELLFFLDSTVQEDYRKVVVLRRNNIEDADVLDEKKLELAINAYNSALKKYNVPEGVHPTPFNTIKEMWRHMGAKFGDVVYDCGVGVMGLPCAFSSLTNMDCIGCELGKWWSIFVFITLLLSLLLIITIIVFEMYTFSYCA